MATLVVSTFSKSYIITDDSGKRHEMTLELPGRQLAELTEREWLELAEKSKLVFKSINPSFVIPAQTKTIDFNQQHEVVNVNGKSVRELVTTAPDATVEKVSDTVVEALASISHTFEPIATKRIPSSVVRGEPQVAQLSTERFDSSIPYARPVESAPSLDQLANSDDFSLPASLPALTPRPLSRPLSLPASPLHGIATDFTFKPGEMNIPAPLSLATHTDDLELASAPALLRSPSSVSIASSMSDENETDPAAVSHTFEDILRYRASLPNLQQEDGESEAQPATAALIDDGSSQPIALAVPTARKEDDDDETETEDVLQQPVNGLLEQREETLLAKPADADETQPAVAVVVERESIDPSAQLSPVPEAEREEDDEDEQNVAAHPAAIIVPQPVAADEESITLVEVASDAIAHGEETITLEAIDPVQPSDGSAAQVHSTLRITPVNDSIDELS